MKQSNFQQVNHQPQNSVGSKKTLAINLPLLAAQEAQNLFNHVRENSKSSRIVLPSNSNNPQGSSGEKLD